MARKTLSLDVAQGTLGYLQPVALGTSRVFGQRELTSYFGQEECPPEDSVVLFVPEVMTE